VYRSKYVIVWLDESMQLEPIPSWLLRRWIVNFKFQANLLDTTKSCIWFSLFQQSDVLTTMKANVRAPAKRTGRLNRRSRYWNRVRNIRKAQCCSIFYFLHVCTVQQYYMFLMLFEKNVSWLPSKYNVSWLPIKTLLYPRIWTFKFLDQRSYRWSIILVRMFVPVIDNSCTHVDRWILFVIRRWTIFRLSIWRLLHESKNSKWRQAYCDVTNLVTSCAWCVFRTLCQSKESGSGQLDRQETPAYI